MNPGSRSRIAGAALVASCFLGCGGAESEVDEIAVETQNTGRIINVHTRSLQPRRFADEIRLTGTVVADRTVTVAAEEGGTVRAVLADKGDRVEAGQVILRLDEELLRAQRDETSARRALAEEMWRRKKRLWEEDGIGTEGEYLEAQYAADQTRAQLALIEERLRRTAVRAPFGGILDERTAEVGAVLAPGEPVALIHDLDPLRVAAGVPERYAARVAVGARATVTFSALGETCQARVAYVGAAVHPGNRTFPIELELAEPPGVIKPEMVADVALVHRVLDDVVVVPREGLVRTEDGFSAFVVIAGPEGPVVEVRPVIIGPSSRDEVVITSGLLPGDAMVVVGQKQITHGDRVRVTAAG